MWLATKFSARRPEQRITEESGPKMPPMKARQDQLGLEGAIEYRRLYEKHPDVELGPDEDLEHHLVRLRSAEKSWRDRPDPGVERRQKAREEGILRPLEPVEPDTNITSWVTGPQAPSSTGLPQRIPGLNTGDSWAHRVPPEWIPRPVPLPNRTPGTHYVDPAIQAARPRQQSRDEWVRGLADKGIFLDSDGRRMAPEQTARPRGRDIWEEFTKPAPPIGRHRAAKVVIAYVNEILVRENYPVARSWSGE